MDKVELLQSLKIKEKLLAVQIPTKDVYSEIISYTTEIVPADRAKEGDVISILVRKDGKESEYSFVIGKGFFPAYEFAVLDKSKGEKIVVDGEDVYICNVKRIVHPPVSDKSVQSIGIEGVDSVEKYKRHYIRTHGDYLRGRVFDQFFPALAAQAIKLLAPKISEKAIEESFEDEKRSYYDYVEGDEEAFASELMKDFEAEDLPTALKALRKQCNDTLKRTAVGKQLAISDGYKEENEDFYAEYLENVLKEYFSPKITIEITEE